MTVEMNISGPTTYELRKSDQKIVLGQQDSLSSQLTVENMTIASTSGYKHIPVQNDVIDFSAWQVGSLSDFAGLIKSFTVSKGAVLTDKDPDPDLHYVNFGIGFSFDNNDSVDFTLNLDNIVSSNVYNKMLQAIDTVAANTDLHSTRDLVTGGETGPNLVIDGNAFTTYKFESDDTTIDAFGTALGLIGILVEEGTIVLPVG